MKAVVQRVDQASVEIEEKTISQISRGILVLLGVEEDDNEKDLEYLVKKISNLRIFPDDKELMNLSVKDIQGEVLVVSQFTLLGDVRKGNRPSYIKAARPQKANEFYEKFIALLKKENLVVKAGEFQAMMRVSLINNGPVTILIDSRKNF